MEKGIGIVHPAGALLALYSELFGKPAAEFLAGPVNRQVHELLGY